MTQNIIGLTVLVAAFALIASGCGVVEEGKIPSDQADIFDSAAELSLKRAVFKEAYPVIETVLKEIFGGAKPTGFLEIMEVTEGGETVVYTLKRESEVQDINSLLQAFFRQGYETEFSIQEGGAASFSVYNAVFNFSASYEIGEQEITFLVDRAQETQ